MTADIERWLRSALGLRLERVQGEFYEGYQAEVHDSLIAVWIQFSGLARVRLFGEADGWGIGVDEAFPTGSDMGPAGVSVIRDMANSGPFSRCLQSPLQDAALFRSPGSDQPVGVRLRFVPLRDVLILNWGDELLVRNRPPIDATADDLVVCPLE